MTTTAHDLRRGEDLGPDDQVLGRLYDHQVVARLLRYVFRHRRWTALAFAAMGGYIATSVAQPLIIAWGINGFIAPPDEAEPPWGSLDLVAIIFLANAAAQMAFSYMQYYAMGQVSVAVLDDLRNDMFAHVQAQSTIFFDRNEAGRIMSRVQNDVLQLQEFIDVVVITIGDVVMLVFIAGTMFWMDPTLASVTLAAPPLLIAVALVWRRFAKVTFLKVRDAVSDLSSTLQQSISGIRVTQSMGRERLELLQFQQLNLEHLDAAEQDARVSSLVPLAAELLSVISMALIVVVGGHMVLRGALEVGFLVAFLLYVLRLFEPIRTLAMQFTEFQRAMAAGERIFELLDLNPAIADSPEALDLPTIAGDIRFDNVFFSYDPGRLAVQDINLHIKPGQTVALVGLSGAGKTTLALLAGRLYDVDKGRITVDGHDIRNVRRQSLARQVSIVLQEPFLYSTSVMENIRYNHREVSEEQVHAAARTVGAHDFIMKLEKGYDTVLQERGGNLSAGQRQLICLARAVAFDPRILILDEATANIDSNTEQLLQKAISAVLSGRTCIVIAHRLSTVIGADQVVVIREGRITEAGTHQELLALEGHYAHLYTLNFAPPRRADTPGSGSRSALEEQLMTDGGRADD